MMEFLVYDLKVAVLIAVFYMFYRLLLSRETFHSVNRTVLLTTAVASFVLPLCVITLHKTVVVEAALGTVGFDGLSAVVEAEAQAPLWQTIIIAAFFVGMVATSVYTLLSVLRVWLLISHSERHPQADGTVICVANGDISPFSWMHYIVLSRSDYEAQDASILAHERGHISRHHSLDLLLVDTLTALQWFNPAMWMLRQDLRAIHEYEADAAVLSQGINMRQYQYLLIQKAVSHCGYSVANGISHSTLKNRITMMLNKKSNSASLLKLLALLPIVGVTLALQAETVTNYVYADKPETPQKKVVKKGRKNGQIKMNDKTIEVKAEKEAEENKDAKTPLELTTFKDDQEKIKIVLNEEQSGATFSGPQPLIVIDGKVSTYEQMTALLKNQQDIDNLTVVQNEEAKKEYAEYFNADTSEGVVFINTKEYVKNGKKEIVGVAVKAKEPADDSAEGAFDVVEQMPEFPGGSIELMKFLSENIKYPEAASKAGTQGRVVAQFIVEADGSITNVKVLKKVSDEIDAEAVRVINAMPKWKPGMQKGKAVRVKYTIPVSFRLS
jgi:TonB family protein